MLFFSDIPKLTKNYSIRRRITIFIAFFFTFLSLITLYVSIYFSNHLRKSAYYNAQNILSLYNTQLSQSLDNFEIFLYDMNQYSSDLSSINISSPEPAIYRHILNLKRLLDYTRPSFKEIDAIFLYAPLSDTYIQSQKNSSHSEITTYLKNLLRSLNKSDRLGEINTTSWFTKTIGNNIYMLRIIKTNNSYIGGWSEISTLTSSFDAISDLNGYVMYLHDTGKPITLTKWENTVFNISESLDNYMIYQHPDGNKFLLSTVSLDYCDYYLAMLIPLNVVDNSLKPIQYFLALIILLLLLLSVTITTTVSHFISAPLHSIEQTAHSIHNGSYTSQLVSPDTNCQELIQINSGFNSLLTEIETLKINVYEEKVAKAEFELLSLKSQIGPHFLINCMHSIFSLVERRSSNYELIQKMVNILSNHLRYALSDRPHVSLGKELSYVDNYIELTQIRFPGSLTYQREIPAEAECACVFPLMILSLTENTIKHNLTMGEPLLLSISAFLYTKESRNYVHITHVDSGSGFSADMLNALSAPEHPDIHQQNGNHIGLFNICRRFRLIYPDDASISFSNEAEMGARIDIDIPISSADTYLESDH